MLRFTIRDLLWLMVVAGMGVGWRLDHGADDWKKLAILRTKQLTTLRAMCEHSGRIHLGVRIVPTSHSIRVLPAPGDIGGGSETWFSYAEKLPPTAADETFSADLQK